MLLSSQSLPNSDSLRRDIVKAYRVDETSSMDTLLKSLNFTPDLEREVNALATRLVTNVRERTSEQSAIEALMMHYDLSTEEGIMLMCLAEALLRIPDRDTELLLMRDKLTGANWRGHIEQSESSLVHFASWGLALTGKVLRYEKNSNYFYSLWKKLIQRSGEPVIRQAVREAIKVMGEQFVLGRSIEEALERSRPLSEKGYTFSFDMLGEVALTQTDADHYYKAYQNAIDALATSARPDNLVQGPGISVKLSALYPRYQYWQYRRAVKVLTERLRSLALQAKRVGISLTVDAEEADRLEMSLDIIETVFADPELKDWHGLGLAVQAYQKRAFYLIDWLIALARKHNKRMMVRLVKGAYWDTEIKFSQMNGFSDYPVFTRKSSTDVSYIACAKKLLSAQDAIYPQFATHNAYTVAAILRLVAGQDNCLFEFQNLQGMGKALHDQIVSESDLNLPCRVYAPVGSHEDLLPYLVRRLLENGANSSFVNQIADASVPIERLVESPVDKTKHLESVPNPKIPLPRDIFNGVRSNSFGADFSDYEELCALDRDMQKILDRSWSATPLNKKRSKDAVAVFDPTDRRREVGRVCEASVDEVEVALRNAAQDQPSWDELGVNARAEILNKVAEQLETHRAELMAMAVREAGKTLFDANAEVREAVDFCRYYANLGIETLSPEVMPGYTGETNVLSMRGRGTILCISPWNFPIAIFTGQIAASLMAGNSVIAKPAEQTPLIAARVVELFHAAGVPETILQCLPGRGETIGAALVSDERINGVVFTGSTDTAKIIQQSLAKRDGPIVPLIAETGGINAMIADSSTLPEQLVADVLLSAFGSAGQRCSALRLLCIQDDVADKVIAMLKGAMAELHVGDPVKLSTDIGPVIDADAQAMCVQHAKDMEKIAKLIHRVHLPEACEHGTFVAPQAFELSDIDQLKREIFGPILHVYRYKRESLDGLIEKINAFGYGLTFGIHSRIDETVDYIQQRIHAGNIYVNRNIIGAVVGVQPFGGGRLSGTGPKAGGPHYLLRLCDETTLTINTTAAGGNASLMAMED